MSLKDSWEGAPPGPITPPEGTPPSSPSNASGTSTSGSRTWLVVLGVIAAPFLLSFGMKALAKQQCLSALGDAVRRSSNPFAGIAMVAGESVCDAAVGQHWFPVFDRELARNLSLDPE